MLLQPFASNSATKILRRNLPVSEQRLLILLVGIIEDEYDKDNGTFDISFQSWVIMEKHQ